MESEKTENVILKAQQSIDKVTFRKSLSLDYIANLREKLLTIDDNQVVGLAKAGLGQFQHYKFNVYHLISSESSKRKRFCGGWNQLINRVIFPGFQKL